MSQYDGGIELSKEESQALAQFLSLVAAHLKTWEVGEFLSHDKAQRMAHVATEWRYRLDSDWYPHPGEPWPPSQPTE